MSQSVYGRRADDASGDDREARSRHSRSGRIAYWVVRNSILVLVKAYCGLQVKRTGNFPEGPFILAPVHRSIIDTPIASLAYSHRMRFMGKESLWEGRLLGTVLSLVGAFPVERGTADRTALRASTDVLALGEPLVMFPEGTRRSGDRLRREDMLDGPAFVAARAEVPIVPLGLGGTARAWPVGSKLPRPRRIIAVVGEPIPPPEKVDGRVPRRAVKELTDRLYDELSDLYVEARVLAGDEPAPA